MLERRDSSRPARRWASCGAAPLACVVALASCGGAPARAGGTQSSRASAPTIALPEGAADVAEVRGLAFERPLALERVSRARFKKILGGLATEDSGRIQLLKAFGFAAMDATPSEGADVRLQAEQLVALYDWRARSVFFREPTPESHPAAASGPQRDAADARRVLAHELTHALQDDHFPLADVEREPEMDVRLARRAAYEGDAIVASALVVARRKGKSYDDAFDDVTLEAAAGAVARSVLVDRRAAPLLARASVLVRAELSFVYDAGATFMTRVYRTGGAELANSVFRALPASTEQVLHPEKYVAGEAPIPVASPIAPVGWETVRTGRLGELATGAFLHEALPIELAIPAARGWGGDAYTVVRERQPESTRLAVLWSTVWDDAPSAARFAAALERATACAPPRVCELGPVFQERRGSRVAWVRGIDAGDALLDGLLRLPARAPERTPPLGAVTLAPAEPLRKTEAPRPDAEGRVPLVAAGLRCRVPPGFHAAPTRSLDLMIASDTEAGASGSLASYDEPFDDRHVEQLRAYFASGFASHLDGGVRLVPTPPRELRTPIGVGTEHRWSVEGSEVRVSVLALPRCNGAAMVFLARVTRTEATRVALDAWLASLEDLPGSAHCARAKQE